MADQETVIASLKRGHHLGQLCHQVSVMIERSLGVDATCWISIANPSGQLEPVINGGFPIEAVAEATSSDLEVGEEADETNRIGIRAPRRVGVDAQDRGCQQSLVRAR